jgi:PIN domain nuclease of toxin-antitoxin system
MPLHHDDPFDHLLIAQAISEALRLMSADSVLARCFDLVLTI